MAEGVTIDERVQLERPIGTAPMGVVYVAQSLHLEWRRSFLERVPENARTLALARAWSEA